MESAVEAVIALSFVMLAVASSILLYGSTAAGYANSVQAGVLTSLASLEAEDLLREVKALSYAVSYGSPPWGYTPSFPDAAAKWIWMEPNLQTAAPPRDYMVCRAFHAPRSGSYTVSVTVDNYYELYVDGSRIGSDGNWATTETYTVTLQAGWHLLTLKVGNAGSTPSPAGLLLSVKDPGGTVLFNTQPDGSWIAYAPGTLPTRSSRRPLVSLYVEATVTDPTLQKSYLTKAGSMPPAEAKTPKAEALRVLNLQNGCALRLKVLAYGGA